MNFKRRYNDHDKDAITRRLSRSDPSQWLNQQTGELGTSMTNEADRDGTDLNILIRRMTTQEIRERPPVNPAAYGDATHVFDLQDMLDQTAKARDLFMRLPATVRAKFDNAPAKLYDYLRNEDNYDEAVKLGILERAPEPKPKESTDGKE